MQEKQEDKDRAEKTPIVHAIVRDIIRGKVSPYSTSQDGGVRKMMRDLYHLDLESLRVLQQTHKRIEENA